MRKLKEVIMMETQIMILHTQIQKNQFENKWSTKTNMFLLLNVVSAN